jgi:multidrug efflux pump subunit AcrA (membrane-fusion protein)
VRRTYKNQLNRARVKEIEMMKKRILIGLVCFLVGLLLLTACGGNAQVANPTPQVAATENQVAESDSSNSSTGFGIEVEGRILPSKDVYLSFKASGQVAEVLVQEGDIIEAGEVIARLGDREVLDANLANAKQAHIAAELELMDANLALLDAQKAYDDLYKSWPEMAIQAEQILTDARQEARDAERNLGYKTGTANQLDIDIAWSQVVLSEKALEDAREDFEPYINKPRDSLARATFQAKLAQAQKDYDRAVAHYNAFKDPSGEFEISQAEASDNIARARLAQAEKDFEALLEGPDPKDVALAEARIERAESRIAAAENNIATTQTNVLAAQAAIDNLDLIAPMDGTVVTLDLIAGDQVAAGEPVAILAAFSSWKVETFDLTERDVPDVYLGQQVAITLDALPDLELSGTVEHISDLYTEKGGDITYTVRIRLDEGDENLRWGMTALVAFIE